MPAGVTLVNCKLKIRQNFGNSLNIEQFHFKSVTTAEIQELLKHIDDKKTTRTDKNLHF